MKIFKKRKLKSDILGMFSALISLAVLAEILYSTHANKNVIMNFEKQYYSKNVSKTAANWLTEHFKQLEIVAKILTKHFESNDIDIYDCYKLLFLESLKRIPFAISFYMAFKDGVYFQCRTLEEIGTFRDSPSQKLPSYAKYAIRTMKHKKKAPENNENAKTQEKDLIQEGDLKIKQDTDSLVEKWTYLNEDFGKIASETLSKASYNATKRDWYVKAELANTLVWSDVYLFKTTKAAGMTISIPLGYDDDGSAIGVLGIDFTMAQFKELLKNIKISENSRSYLLNNKSEVIETSTDIKTYAIDEETGELKMMPAMDCDDPVLKSAVQNIITQDEEHINFKSNGVPYVASIQKFESLPCVLLTIAPESDFTTVFDEVQKMMILLSIMVFICAILTILILAKRISKPIVDLCASAKAVGSMDLDNYPEPPKSNIYEISELSDSMNSMKFSVATFAKYAPKELVRRLIGTRIQPVLGGTTKNITLFFSDIEKFSTVSEKLPAEYLILHLSEYFDEMTKEIMNCNGVIDKYIGDSIMAMWGAPDPDEEQVVNACYAALNCQLLLDNLGEKWTTLGKPPLPTRIGLHTGTAIVGNIGCSDRMNFTSIGDTVNIASRLEGANKFYGTKILASEAIENIAKGKILFRVIDRIAVKGREKGITVFEPLGAMNNAEDEKYYEQIQLCAKSDEAFERYQNGEFKDAFRSYEKILESFPQVKASIVQIMERCREYSQNPPTNWDGVSYLTSK